MTRDERGAQAVEFALLALPIMMLIYGFLAMGFVLFEQVTASQLAREAARSAAICAANPSGPAPATCAANRYNLNRPPGFASWGGTFDGVTVNCAAGAIGAEARVSVNPALPMSVFGWGLTKIHGKATTPCGG
jgi:Flp pilus assembly protein TadG